MFTEREREYVTSCSEGAVVTFTIVHDWGRAQRKLSYVAYLAGNGRWYTTASEDNGKVDQIMDTTELLALFAAQQDPVNLYIAGEWHKP